MEIVNQDWEESNFFEKLESKFLFVVFQQEGASLVFKQASFWNMPYSDREEAKRVWEDTKRRVEIDATDLPKVSESSVAHVRPKARNAQDTLPTPQGAHVVKKCFWLNKNYIKQVIDSLN